MSKHEGGGYIVYRNGAFRLEVAVSCNHLRSSGATRIARFVTRIDDMVGRACLDLMCHVIGCRSPQGTSVQTRVYS